ncbi:MAG TPA: hypothetical protein VFR82_09845, partial [Nitrospira sp.]|nr:hypothetical protein [Nitrospira sp.]
RATSGRRQHDAILLAWVGSSHHRLSTWSKLAENGISQTSLTVTLLNEHLLGLKRFSPSSFLQEPDPSRYV